MEVSTPYNQGMASHHGPLEEVLIGCAGVQKQQQQTEKKPRPQPEQALRCPRCDSTNTKFCYYNNYSLSQPRYFCKGCRRYWTQGGCLRNVPVGGGCRKKRPSSSSSSSSSKRAHDESLQTNFIPPLIPTLPPPPSPTLSYNPSDLTLAFASLHNQGLGLDDHVSLPLGKPNPNHSYLPGSFLDILRSGISNPGCLQNTYFGSESNANVVLPINGGLGGETASASSSATSSVTSTGTPTMMAGEVDGNVMEREESKVGMNLPWQYGGDLSMGLADSGRDYWNGVSSSSSSSWHGLINNSLL